MKRLFCFKSIYIKFVVVFVGILWFSSTIAFTYVFSFYRDDVITLIQQTVRSKANSIVEFHRQYDIPPKDIQKLLNDDSVRITIYDDIDALNMLSEDEKAAVEQGKIVETRRNKRLHLPAIAMKLDGSYIFLTTSPNRDVMVFFRNILGLVLSVCAVLGSILIAIASRMIVKPIKQLTKATKEVAKGNFDIKLDAKSCDEIGQLSENFNIMTQELNNIEYLRKDFISSVSHEFKTPMTAIQGFAKLLKGSDLTKEQANEYTDIIISETGRLANLSNNLLKLSSLENQVIREQHRKFSLDEQLRKVILLLEPKWSEKDLQLDLDLQEVQYTGDEELLRQVWINLIENAVKFSNPGESLHVAITASSDVLKVIIRDHGIGISDHDKDKIFERFYKADKARSKDGNGLGLPIVRKIIELHNGKIHFESSLGIGTTFVVELPNK